ncbi:NAD(+) diphosphatase [Cohaesibacter celericrescens]|uniref:NAD(+) diphosphatase n=1 Tax=Cohaesibacter celericrescens TaxID=2067669 RepID=UPI0035699AC9
MDIFSGSDVFAETHTLPSFDKLGYAHNRLDRDTEHRDENSLGTMVQQTQARYYLLHDDNVLLRIKDGQQTALFCLERAQKLGADMDRVILLGTDPEEDNAPRLAVPLTDQAIEALATNEEYVVEGIRAVGLKDLLPPDQLGAIAQARSLLTWHVNHQFCSKCGASTVVALAGARRDCPSCSAVHFPRTDPVVIMLAIHRDESGVERCLLGHHARFDTPMYSTLAGFMEHGETLEAAVRREILEESCIKIGAVRYLTSQPWPFPSSLMLGCFAEALSSNIQIDETELTEARWFTRQEVREMMARPAGDELPHIPGRFSIAAWLIRFWVDAG